MKMSFGVVVWSTFLTSFLTNCLEGDTKVKKSDFVSLLDDMTLNGWMVMPAKANQAWSAKNEMIVGKGKKGRSYLVFTMNRAIADFEMKFLYRFPG